MVAMLGTALGGDDRDTAERAVGNEPR